nr:N-alpha-acetyltransferase 80 [Anolis sagrei ordinatus]
MGSVSEMLTVVPLHQRPDLLEACVDLINEEWKRSRASRIHSLQRSNSSFPLCLVLIRTQRPVEETPEGKQSQSQLLGHARLSRVVGRPKSLFVETVVVAKALRGKGYGRKLMEAVESYAKSRGFCHLHLTTHDKQHFYAHLGYHYSKPVQCAGFVSSLVPVGFLESVSHPQHDEEHPAGAGQSDSSASYSSRSGSNFPSLGYTVSPSPSSVSSGSFLPPPLLPPPPPPPPGFSFQLDGSSVLEPVPFSSDNVSATAAPQPTSLPPPPPVPPPKAPLPGQPNSCELGSCGPPGDKAQEEMLQGTPYRDLRARPIFWMEKDI